MFCAYTMPRYQVSVYRTIGPLITSDSCTFAVRTDTKEAYHSMDCTVRNIRHHGQLCRHACYCLAVIFYLSFSWLLLLDATFKRLSPLMVSTDIKLF